MKFNSIPALSLQLLAEGGDGGAGTTGVTGQAAAGQDTGVKDLSQVQYGRQEEPVQAAAEQQEQPPVDLDAEFEELIKGKYKDQYDKRTQETIQKRLKGSKETEKAYKAQAPIMDTLAARYGVDAGDVEGLLKALQDDDALYEAEALQKGMSVEQLKSLKKVELENASMRRQMEEAENERNAQQLYSQWMADAAIVQQTYPNFDLVAELSNEQFTELLGAHVPMKTAYEVVHHDEILPAAMQFAAKTVEQKVVNSVAAGRSRPRENGIAGQAGIATKSDPSKLTFADIDEINRRVMRGERITF